MENIKKIYVDSRHCLKDTNQSGKFTVVLPFPILIEKDCKMFIDNVVIPISYYTITNNNNKIYLNIFYLNGSNYVNDKFILTLPVGNYSGTTFRLALEILLNSIITTNMKIKFEVGYELINNNITIKMFDLKTSFDNSLPVVASFISDYDLVNSDLWSSKLKINDIKSLNLTLKIIETVLITSETVFTTYLDLHSIRNIYMHSATLANSDTISNWNIDTIIKIIPVHSQYNTLNFDGITNSYDYQLIKKRTIQNIDVYFTDSYNNIIDFNGSHLSFSILFVYD